MSFPHTAEQVLARMQSVTRRLGWKFIKPGDCFRAVRPVRRELVEILAVCEVVSITRERLDDLERRYSVFYARRDMFLEGFPGMAPKAFVNMFCHRMRCARSAWVTRIHFRYVE